MYSCILPRLFQEIILCHESLKNVNILHTATVKDVHCRELKKNLTKFIDFISHAF